MTKEERKCNFIEKARELHDDKYDYSMVEYINNSLKVKIVCPIHGEFEQIPRSHVNNGSGCPECANNKISIDNTSNVDEFVKKAKKVHGNKYDYNLTVYINAKTKVKIDCPKHGFFEQTPDNHISKKHNCPECKKDKLRLFKLSNTNEFINKAKKIHGDKYDYNLVDYIDAHKRIKIICPKHGIFEQTPNRHLDGSGCVNCVKDKFRLTEKELIESFIKTHGDKYDYSEIDYKNSKTKIKINCPEHGKFDQLARNHRKGIGCPYCNESHGEREISLFLTNLKINYVREKRFTECKDKKSLPFDFYLPEYNVCIEFDGIQHFQVNNYWNGEKGFETIKKHDKIKNIYCKKNGINLMRIKYDEKIEEKLKVLI